MSEDLSARENALMKQFFAAHAEENKIPFRAGDGVRLSAIRSSSRYFRAFEENPKVSIIVPSFNRADLILKRAIPSVLAQSYHNWELIIVGDQMADEQIKILGDVSEIDSRISFFNLKKRGNYPKVDGPRWYVAGTKPINFGLRIASGDWIAHLDDDDEFLPDHLESLLRIALNKKVEWVHTKVLFKDDNGGDQLVVGGVLPTHGNISRISSIYHQGLKTFRYNPYCWRYYYPSDWDLWERLLVMGVSHQHHDGVTAIHHGDYYGALRRMQLGNDSVPRELDNHSGTAENQAKSYQNWCLSRTLTPAQRGWMEESADGFTTRPTFSLCMFASSEQCDLVLETWFSLQAQIYNSWHLNVVSFDSAPSSFPSSDYCHWHVIGEDDDSLIALNNACFDCDSDWVGVIYPGDRLAPDCLFRFAFTAVSKHELSWIYCDEDTLTRLQQRISPLFKPDFNRELLRSLHYVGGLSLVRTEKFRELGGFDPAFEGVEDYDLSLRLSATLVNESIGHLADVLYHRFEDGRLVVLEDEERWLLGKAAIERHLGNSNVLGNVSLGPYPMTFSVIYGLPRKPSVSIIIPTRDHAIELSQCLESIYANTNHQALEIIVVDNQTAEQDALDVIHNFAADGGRVLKYDAPFNFAEMCNLAAEQSKSEYLLFLNNDVVVSGSDWLEILLGFALQPDVGVVGPRLLLEDGRIQHAGVVLGLRHRPAEHVFIGSEIDAPSLLYRSQLSQNYSAVTGACLLISKADYFAVDGMDSEQLPTTYQDIDLCLKVVTRLKKSIVWTPLVTLTHAGSKTFSSVENKDVDGNKKRADFFKSQELVMFNRWAELISNDPAYNRNLTRDSCHAGLEIDPILTSDASYRPKPHLLACPADNTGCGEYRIKAPMRALMRAGLVDGDITDRIYGPSEILRINPDVVVFQRQLEGHQLEAIARYRDRTDALLIYELDDLITEGWGTRGSEEQSRLFEKNSKVLEQALGLVDRFIASTPSIADAFGRWCKEVVVLPNYIPNDRWGALLPRRLDGRKPRVGWAGGASHAEDLEMISMVVKALHREVNWVFLGLCPEPLRPYVYEFHPGVPIDGYPAKLADLSLDLALAPLVDNAFNRSRTALRVLEYGVLGYPVIASDMPSFRSGGFPVTLVPEDCDAWIEAIRTAIADRMQLAASGDQLRKCIQENWMLDSNLDVWRNAWLP